MPFDLPYADLMEKHGFISADHAAPRFFPVEARKLYDEKGHEVDGYRRIVNADTNKTLNVTSVGYSLITNERLFSELEDKLRESKLDLTDMRIGTEFARDGARVFRQYMLPAHRVTVKPGVDVALRILALNSYDGSSRCTGRAGAYNFVCANTSIFGTDIAGFKLRHSGDLDLSGAVAGLVKAAEDHVAEASKWRVWPDIRITDVAARALIQTMPGISRVVVDYLVHRYLVARDTDELQGGPNLWTLYNVLTAWSTHGEVDEKRKGNFGAQVRSDREEVVRKTVTGAHWIKTIEHVG